MRDLFVVDLANSGTGGGATRLDRLSSALVGEGTIAENGRPTTEQVVCDALHLALVTTHLRVVWHARVVTAERAMQLLDQAFREIRVHNEEEEINRDASYSELPNNSVSRKLGELS
jgi:hypothetical protein